MSFKSTLIVKALILRSRRCSNAKFDICFLVSQKGYAEEKARITELVSRARSKVFSATEARSRFECEFTTCTALEKHLLLSISNEFAALHALLDTRQQVLQAEVSRLTSNRKQMLETQIKELLRVATDIGGRCDAALEMFAPAATAVDPRVLLMARDAQLVLTRDCELSMAREPEAWAGLSFTPPSAGLREQLTTEGRVVAGQLDLSLTPSFGTSQNSTKKPNMARPVALSKVTSPARTIVEVKEVKEARFAGVFARKWGIGGSRPGQLNIAGGGLTVNASGEVLVVERNNNRVQVFSAEGKFIRAFGKAGSGPAQLDRPGGVAVNFAGIAFVTDASNNRVQVFGSDGRFMCTIGQKGRGDGQFEEPKGIAVSISGDIYVTDCSTHRVQLFRSDGTFIRAWGTRGAGNGEFNGPSGIAVATTGDVYVSDTGNHRMQVFRADGQFVSAFGSRGTEAGHFNSPRSVSVSSAGDVFVADSWNHRIQMFRSDGAFVNSFGSRGRKDGQFEDLGAIAVASYRGSGEAREVYIALKDRVLVFR